MSSLLERRLIVADLEFLPTSMKGVIYTFIVEFTISSLGGEWFRYLPTSFRHFKVI